MNMFDDVRETLREAESRLSDAEREYKILLSRTITSGLFSSPDGEDVYGWEGVLDICNCDASRFTRTHLESFFDGLCRDILVMSLHDL